jgi:hypothetical protein
MFTRLMAARPISGLANRGFTLPEIGALTLGFSVFVALARLAFFTALCWLISDFFWVLMRCAPDFLFNLLYAFQISKHVTKVLGVLDPNAPTEKSTT